MELTEIKLNGETETFNTGDGNYKVCKRNKENKQGGGVKVIGKRNIRVEEVIHIWRRTSKSHESEN